MNIDDIIIKKDYSQLNEQEKSIVDEQLGGKDNYMDLRSAIMESRAHRELKTNKSTKASLDARFKPQHQSAWKISTASLASLLLITVLMLILREPEVVTNEVPVYVDRVQRDTVILASDPDTVYVTREVKVEVPYYITEVKQPEATAPIKGQTLADKKELKELLTGVK